MRGIIVPLRFRQSAKLYQEIWTKEGSPLLVHSRDLQQKIQDQLSSNYVVELAMRYQQPSIDEALQRLQNSLVSQIIVLPLFPQYASATTGSVHKKIMQSVMDWPYIPKLTFINNFASYEGFINSICARASEHDLNSYDHILFSFHGLPQRQIKTADLSGNCLTNNCCNTLNIKNHYCYRAQSVNTAKAVASKLKLLPDRYSICFQSRLGSDPWLEPYTSDIIAKLAAEGKRRVLVFSPSFVTDCLETLSEIAIEYDLEFKELGGEKLQLVESLNSHPTWVKALSKLCMQQVTSDETICTPCHLQGAVKL